MNVLYEVQKQYCRTIPSYEVVSKFTEPLTSTKTIIKLLEADIDTHQPKGQVIDYYNKCTHILAGSFEKSKHDVYIPVKLSKPISIIRYPDGELATLDTVEFVHQKANITRKKLDNISNLTKINCSVIEQIIDPNNDQIIIGLTLENGLIIPVTPSSLLPNILVNEEIKYYPGINKWLQLDANIEESDKDIRYHFSKNRGIQQEFYVDLRYRISSNMIYEYQPDSNISLGDHIKTNIINNRRLSLSNRKNKLDKLLEELTHDIIN